ncbi:hypothetical protein [Actinomadura rudentiformis]|nr:hypothetical protein [Actinomadura rudentiformis]
MPAVATAAAGGSNGPPSHSWKISCRRLEDVDDLWEDLERALLSG